MEIVFVSLGWIGAGLEIAAFALLTAGRMSAAGNPYLLMNLAGGIALLVNTASLAAWPSAVLNLVWLSIGLVGLFKGWRVRHRPESSGETPAAREVPTAP